MRFGGQIKVKRAGGGVTGLKVKNILLNIPPSNNGVIVELKKSSKKVGGSKNNLQLEGSHLSALAGGITFLYEFALNFSP